MEQLDESTVIRAGQRPALVFYVPINVFLIEAALALFLFRVIGFWVVILLPIHFYFVIKTADDYHWVQSFLAWREHCLFAGNKGLHGDDVITFTANPIKPGKKDYADFY